VAQLQVLKYIYNNGSDEVIRRAKKIHSTGFIEMVDHDPMASTIVFRVKDDSYATFYKVNVQKYTDVRQLSMRCTCPYNMGDICRHEAAALFRLQDMADKNMLGNLNIDFDQRHTILKMKQIDLKSIKMLSSPDIYDKAETILRTKKANILRAANECVEAELIVNDITFPVIIRKNEERNFDTSCSCSEARYPLCEHKTLLFLQLLNAYGPHYFDSIRDWDKEKNKLLQIYGYSLQDDLSGKFEFIYKEGKPFLKVLDPSIKRVATPIAVEKPASPLPAPSAQPVGVPVKEKVVASVRYRIGVVFQLDAKRFPGFTIHCIKGEADEDNLRYVGKTELLDLSKHIDLDTLEPEDQSMLLLVRKMQESEINKFVSRNSPFSAIWDNIIQEEGDTLPEETRRLIIEYLHPKLKKLFTTHASHPFVFLLPAGKKFVTAQLQDTQWSESMLHPVYKVQVAKGVMKLLGQVKAGSSMVPLEANLLEHHLIFIHQHTLFTWDKMEDALHSEEFLQKGTVADTPEAWRRMLHEQILPLSRTYQVAFDKSLLKEVKGIIPEIKLQLMEQGENLLFIPVFNYQGYDVKAGGTDTITLPIDDKVLLIYRNREKENAFFQSLESLHSSFSLHQDGRSLYLRGSEVLKQNWFFLFMDAMNEMKVPVFGFETLRHFKFNTARPKTQIHVSSGLDWFDARVEIDFDGQRVGINDIKKALADKQTFVQLGDGTLGILPDEWIKKYALLFKVGDGKTDKLRLSRYHLSVIDELYENRDEQEISFALDEKMERLRGFKKIPKRRPPENLVPVLRPYQEAGFHWLHYLNEVGWGGILADDMGLGKTVQALTMLQQYRQSNGQLLALVVCPTTLIYNWQNEVRKFTPELTYHIHHGNARYRKPEELNGFNILITTYGTLRSDISLFLQLFFDYIVLDESQAIKNPSSKVTKAATLLTAKNRICMSGTPLQNNTFDIYAQMNFLNPGLLGSMEYFRDEFATPIDKFGEAEHKEHLRKLLHPFILRRTKEQVAKDLPEKTETILFCEMEEEQRSIYEAYRNAFREKILGTIDQQGIDKSQLTILQGLMKLRQICDSPAILNEDVKYPNTSIKLDELTREITENIGEHKALVFSQFLGMLGLIRKQLEALQIPYAYFDGSTTTGDREKAIRLFQEEDTCRVFLISLKAGGVGLNLTAADYVYIVDPWWNPAVEQQAIDRTHRIGQTKNIFAYRMICVDTIEDKILQLQEKKRTLAKELIADENGFVKSLSRSDVEYLFS
jgi:superfamily II DNA or RNA helicase